MRGDAMFHAPPTPCRNARRPTPKRHTQTLFPPPGPQPRSAIGCCQPVTHEYLYCNGGGTTSTPGPSCAGWQVLIDTVRALSPSTAIVPGPDGCLVNGEQLGGTYPLYHATSVLENSYTCTEAGRPFAGPFFSVPESDFSTCPRNTRKPPRGRPTPNSTRTPTTQAWQKAGSGTPATAASVPRKSRRRWP